MHALAKRDLEVETKRIVGLSLLRGRFLSLALERLKVIPKRFYFLGFVGLHKPECLADLFPAERGRCVGARWADLRFIRLVGILGRMECQRYVAGKLLPTHQPRERMQHEPPDDIPGTVCREH